MPPHSEVENDVFAPIHDVRCRGTGRSRKRSRSISPDYVRRVGQNAKKSSRSTSVSGDKRDPVGHVSSLVSTLPALPLKRPVEKDRPNAPIVVTYQEAPLFLQGNPFIFRGYRTNLCTITCLKSLFWWTNETLNAWTHLLGWMYFAYFTVQEVIKSVGYGASSSISWHDNLMMIMILVCFQICMALSTGYHTFCCHSHDAYHCWLSYDLCGISFSLLAIYTTGIYYAFWCHDTIRTVYIGISFSLFAVSLILQTTPKFLTDDYSRARLLFFVSWSVFGFLPCFHWVAQNGMNQTVFDLVSQIGIMYLICGIALFFYVTKIPEIWFPGSVDYIGSSHQWWHIIIFYAFYHWQNTGKYFSDFRAHHGCFEVESFGKLGGNSTIPSLYW